MRDEQAIKGIAVNRGEFFEVPNVGIGDPSIIQRNVQLSHKSGQGNALEFEHHQMRFTE
jgi:hypothetical protein